MLLVPIVYHIPSPSDMKFLLLWKFNQTSVLWLARQLQGISKPDCFLWILAQTSSGSHCKMSFQLQTISYSLEFAHRQHFNNINMYFISKKYNVFQFPINSKCSVFVFSLTLREPWSVAEQQRLNFLILSAFLWTREWYSESANCRVLAWSWHL